MLNKCNSVLFKLFSSISSVKPFPKVSFIKKDKINPFIPKNPYEILGWILLFTKVLIITGEIMDPNFPIELAIVTANAL